MLCCSRQTEQTTQRWPRIRSLAIDWRLERYAYEQGIGKGSIINFGVFGARRAGKTTFIHRSRMLQDAGPYDFERQIIRPAIRENMLKIAHSILDAAEECEQVEFTERQLGVMLTLRSLKIGRNEGPGPLASNHVKLLEQLWEIKAVRRYWEEHRKSDLSDDAKYFMRRLRSIVHEDYVPTDRDIVQCSYPTKFLEEHRFLTKICGSWRICMYEFADSPMDPIPNRSQRIVDKIKRSIDVLVCVIAIDEYDTTDPPLQEGIDRLRAVVDDPVFFGLPFVIVLSKFDVFEEKIKTTPISSKFPQYKGPEKNADIAAEFLEALFTAHLRISTFYRRVYTHRTTAKWPDRSLGSVWRLLQGYNMWA